MSKAELRLDEAEAQAVAVLATATIGIVGRDAPVVASLQQLLRDRTIASYEAASRSFDDLTPQERARIAESAPSVARRRLKNIGLPGLLGALGRR